MNAKEMWQVYCQERDFGRVDFWQYGVAADKLAKLTLDGVKTATASAYDLYLFDNTEDLPEINQYSVISDSKDEAICIIKTNKVTLVPFNEVTAEHAHKEGEGDRSLAYWRKVHQEFFTDCLKEVGLLFKEEMIVVCEEFEVVYPR